MKKYFTSIILVFCLSLPVWANASSKLDKLVALDTTERLENIDELKHNIRSLKVQMRTLEIALVEAKKKRSGKKTWNRTKRYSDAVSALATLGGAIAGCFFEDKIRVLKISSFIFGISSSVGVLSGLAADLTTDEADNVQTKIDEIIPLLKATETNLTLEVKLLCQNEPSNQKCR